MLRTSTDRPVSKQHVVFDASLNNCVYQLPRLFPGGESPNLGFSLVSMGTPVRSHVSRPLLYPTYMSGANTGTTYYERWCYEPSTAGATLFEATEIGQVSNLNPGVVHQFRKALGEGSTEDDVFLYVYGVLHSPEFRQTFEANLRKEAPRVPLVGVREVFDGFAGAGRKLCDLHVGYETVEPYPLVEEWANGVDPERHPEAVGTRNPSGIDWIIDRWYVKTDKASGIVNDVNQ